MHEAKDIYLWYLKLEIKNTISSIQKLENCLNEQKFQSPVLSVNDGFPAGFRRVSGGFPAGFRRDSDRFPDNQSLTEDTVSHQELQGFPNLWSK